MPPEHCVCGPAQPAAQAQHHLLPMTYQVIAQARRCATVVKPKGRLLTVFAVEPGTGHCAQEELATVSRWSGVRHAETQNMLFKASRQTEQSGPVVGKATWYSRVYNHSST